MSSPVISEVLPTELRLGPPPTMPQARSYLFKQQSDLQEYNVEPGNVIKINIPRLQQTYLTKDSYIRFRINVDAQQTDAGLYFDRTGAMALFDRLEVYDYLGGTLLERVSDLPLLYTLQTDLNVPFSARNGKYNATQGTSLTSSITNPGSFNPFIQFPSGDQTNQAGIQFLPITEDPLGNRNQSIEFCIPVPSFLGMFSTKFVPLHNGFTIYLYLNSTSNAFVSRVAGNNAGTPVNIVNCWLTNVELCCQVIELGKEAEGLVHGSNGGNPWVIPCSQFRSYKNSVSSSSPVFRQDMNLNVVSLKNIRFVMTPSVYFNNIAYPVYGHRVKNFLSNFNFQYGSSYLPELAGINCRGVTVPNSRSGYTQNKDAELIYGGNQAYVELLKTTNGLWSDIFGDVPINFAEFRVETAFSASGTESTAFTNSITGAVPTFNNGSYNGTTVGKFAGGIDLRLNNKAIVSGIDTNGLLVCLNGTFDSRYVDDRVDVILTAFAEYDAFVQIIPGVASTVTF